MRQAVVDGGPLVAFLSARDHHHGWAKRAFAAIAPPLLTCEAVLTEAWHLLRGTANGHASLLELLTMGIVVPEFRLKDELAAVKRLTARYKDRPTSLADACLVRLCELYDDAAVVTVDRDFVVYRKHGRQAIPLIAPFL